MLPFPLVFWDFAFASLIRPLDDFNSCSRVWPRMPVVPMFAFSVFISGRTAPIGNDTTYLKDEKASIDEIKLTPLELSELIASIKNGTISAKIDKEVTMLQWGVSPVAVFSALCFGIVFRVYTLLGFAP